MRRGVFWRMSPYLTDSRRSGSPAGTSLHVESPRGLSPLGAPRSVREPLDSYGSRCSAVSMTELPMGEECWIYPAYPVKPVSCTLGLPTQPFELAARPADDIEIDPLQGRTQLRLVEVAVVVDPAANARVVHLGQVLQGLVAAMMKRPAPNCSADGRQRLRTGGGQEARKGPTISLELCNRLCVYPSRSLVGPHMFEGSPEFPLGDVERLCLAPGLLPSPVGPWPWLNNAAPLVQLHYRAFIPTTSCSAPVLRFGTLVLAVCAAWTSPLASERQVLTFRTRAWLSFAPPTCRMPLGQASGFSRADPGGRGTPRFRHRLIRFRHIIGGSLALASLNLACRDPVPTFPQRSPPSLLTTAACGGLRPAPDCRPRRALLHLSYSSEPSY